MKAPKRGKTRDTKPIYFEIPAALLAEFDAFRAEKYPNLSRQQMLRSAMAHARAEPETFHDHVGRY